MGFADEVYSRLPKEAPILPAAIDDFAKRKISPRLSILRKRIRIKGSSTVTVPLGVVLLFPAIVILLIIFLFVKHPDAPTNILIPSGAPPSIRKINEKYDKPFVTGCLVPQVDGERANAAFVVLARNTELEGVLQSMKSIERHFNHWFNYPYVFLNDGDFNETFKEEVQKYASSPCEFGKIEKTMWGFPDWVDHDVAKESIAKQGDRVIMYGGMESYHHMCRFYSGFFFDHPLLAKYKWYWRLEPEIKYFCDITYDPFIHMERHNKTYGFTIAVKELKETVPNLFRYASAYKRLNNIADTTLWPMFAVKGEKPKEEKNDLPDDVIQPGSGTLPPIDSEMMENEKYNMCHFWSNFEIARLDFFRNDQYRAFFQMMDKSSGFWTERWGDAPIHSLAAGIFLDVKDVHYFRDMGYRHTTIQHCPANSRAHQLPRQKFVHENDVKINKKAAYEDDEYWSRPDKWKENGVGCRCVCDKDIPEVEGKEGSCTPEWVDVAGGWVAA